MKGKTTPSLLTLNMKALPLGMTSLLEKLATAVKLLLSAEVFSLRMYRMNLSTGLLPLKVGVHLIASQRGPMLKMVTFSGGSGSSEKVT